MRNDKMKSDPVILILGFSCFLVLAAALQFGEVTGYGPGQHEGRVIDVVIKGIAQAVAP